MNKEATIKGFFKAWKNKNVAKKGLAEVVESQKPLRDINMAKGKVTKAKNQMKQESADLFGAKDAITPIVEKVKGKAEQVASGLYSKVYKPIVKETPGIPTPKQTAGRIKYKPGKKTKSTAENPVGEPNVEENIPFTKKHPVKEMALAGAGGYALGKMTGIGKTQTQYDENGFPIKYASVRSLLKAVGNTVPSKGAEAVGKTMLSVGAGGLGVGLVSGYLVGDDGHSKADHGRKKEGK